MKKISTLFKKDPNDLGRVINEINPENNWIFDKGVTATRKWDGTSCAIINGELYKRYDVKKGKSIPENAIPCQEPDEITGHWPHWVKCDRSNNGDQWHFKAFDEAPKLEDGTYELCGPKIQGNPEDLKFHYLVKHGKHEVAMGGMPAMKYASSLIFVYFEKFLSDVNNNIEGIVFHHPDGRMCKLRKSDYGIKR